MRSVESISLKAPIGVLSLFFICSLIVLLVFRVIYSTPVEIDGDSVGKWLSASSVARYGQWSVMEWDHHQLRWSIMLPQILVAKIIPWRYESYYILPMLFYSLFTVICMLVLLTKVGRSEWAWTLLLAIAMSIDPISHVMASQLKTVAFGLFYLSIGILIFGYYLNNQRVCLLLLSALFFFLSYGSHITYLVFSVAPLLVLVLHLKAYRSAVIFGCALLVLLLTESVLTSLYFGGIENLGRIHNIMLGTSHQPVTTARGLAGSKLEYGDLFTRWRLVPKYNFLILVGYLLGISLLLIKRIRQSIPISIWLFFYSAGV